MEPTDARHSTWATAQRAAALVNVLSGTPTPEQVADVLRAHGEREPLHLTGSDVRAMAAVADELRGVFAAADLARAVDALNQLLRACPGPVRLSAHAGASPWHLHADADDDAPWDEWLRASSALALAVLVTDRQITPGGVCAAHRCNAVFVSERTGSSRRFCSRRCATRERVAAHRRRGTGPIPSHGERAR